MQNDDYLRSALCDLKWPNVVGQHCKLKRLVRQALELALRGADDLPEMSAFSSRMVFRAVTTFPRIPSILASLAIASAAYGVPQGRWLREAH